MVFIKGNNLINKKNTYKNHTVQIISNLFARIKSSLMHASLSVLILILAGTLLFAENAEKEFYEKYKDKKINVSLQNTDIGEVIKIFSKKMDVNYE